jgi:hypothetical protein
MIPSHLFGCVSNLGFLVLNCKKNQTFSNKLGFSIPANANTSTKIESSYHPEQTKTFQRGIIWSSIWWLFEINFSTSKHQNVVKNIDINKASTRHLFDILIWLDINKRTSCCIKTLKHFQLIIKVLICLVEMAFNNYFKW